MRKKIKELILILAVSLTPTLLIWFPFFLRLEKVWGVPLSSGGMATIVANYDGPLFLVVAKTFYDKGAIKNFPFSLPVEYYAAHFPLFPTVIRIFSIFTNFPYAMLAATVTSSILAIYFFNKFIKDFVDQKDARWLTFVFAIFPARFLIVRSVGSSEPLFIGSIIASIYYFRKEKYWLAGLWGAISQLTKSAGILLFVSYLLIIIYSYFKSLATSGIVKNKRTFNFSKYLPLILIPIALLGTFTIFKLTYNDFFAYFHSGDNIHLFFPPFAIFNYSSAWVGTIWLEEIILVYLIGILGLLQLIKQKEEVLAFFVGVFFVSIMFVSHRDILRYSLPIVPFLLASFSDLISKKEFKIAIIFLLFPIFLYTLAFISQNAMPISDWSPFL